MFHSTLPQKPFFHLLNFGILEKDFYMNQARSSLSMWNPGQVAVQLNFVCALGTVGSVMTTSLSINTYPHLKTVNNSKKEWQVLKFRLRRIKRLDVIQKRREKETPLVGCCHSQDIKQWQTMDPLTHRCKVQQMGTHTCSHCSLFQLY